MNTEITICDIKVPTKREEVCNQAKIHNELLEDLVNNLHYTREEAKNFIKAIARNSIRNLKIIY